MEKKVSYWLKKYKKREVTLRKVAKELNLSLWDVLELVGKNQSYEASDLERDLREVC